MRAGIIRKFGPPSEIVVAEMARPQPSDREVLVRIKAAGVGPWDALVREGKSVTSPPLPLILGSDLAGVVEAVGSNVSNASQFRPGDEVFGVANEQFSGGYAEYAAAPATMLAHKPTSLNYFEAASAPIVAVTAYQMLFEYGHLAAGQTVLVHGGAGSVGAYAVQLARNAGAHVIATAGARDIEYVRGLGAEQIIDYRAGRFEDEINPVDVVIDTVGGETRQRSLRVVAPDGILVSSASPIPDDIQSRLGAKAVFFIVEVNTSRLDKIRELFESGKLRADVGTILPLNEAKRAHEMLAGAPHARGKIVLNLSA